MLRVTKVDEFQLLKCLSKCKREKEKTDEIHFNELHNPLKEKKMHINYNHTLFPSHSCFSRLKHKFSSTSFSG